jgi:hypothetical protein
MSSTPRGSSRDTQVKERPSWLRALGLESPPETIEISGETHRLRETFKHDSWAATALYEGPAHQLRVVKLHRKSSLLGIPMARVGLWTARNEIKLLGSLAGLKGIPVLAGPVRIDGPNLENAVAREYVAGHPLGNRERVNDQFFGNLQQLLRSMHERRIVYVDLHKRENIIVTEAGDPCLIDFQISLLWPLWLPLGPLFRIFCRSDEYHLITHWFRCRPDQCGVEYEDIKRRKPWWIKVHRQIAQPIREFRRWILVRIGVRSGRGRVETETFAEHALRDISNAEDRAA